MAYLSAIVGFVFGVLAVLAVEVGLVVYFIRRLSKKSGESGNSGAVSSNQHILDHSESVSSIYQKQGFLWILEPETVPEVPSSAEQTRKKDIVLVSPVRKPAKIKDRMLILTEADGSLTKIILKGCQVLAVSATSLPSRKWAKRFPIKVESKTGVLYHKSKVLHVYAETSWEKESWCKALRIASSDSKEKLLWFNQLSEDFRFYLKSLTEGHPSLLKPYGGYNGGLVKGNQIDEPPSKVRQFFRKLSKKSHVSPSDEKKNPEKSRFLQDTVSSNIKTSVPANITNNCVEDSPSVSSAGSSTRASDFSEADASERLVADEGTLCWNLLISRLFFDAKNNVDIKTALMARIQRTLSNMRTPGYIGELSCTAVDPGNLPPYILAMRGVPTDMNDLWALEMDIEYSGGVVLDIETRLEMGELDFAGNPNNESSSAGEADFLEDFRHLEEELRLSDGSGNSTETKESGDYKGEKVRSSGTGLPPATPASRWKTILNSVAKHVSQVPLALTIKVVSLRGTIQLHIKPPPTDQLWFGFTTMPDINFQVECSVKDHRITSGRIPTFFINRFKASIRETLVLPSCESAYVPWMLAEKDDWLSCNAAPLMWLNRESTSDSTEVSYGQSSKTQVKRKKADPVKPERVSSSDSQDMRTPLLRNEETRESRSIVLRKDNDHGNRSQPSGYVSLKEERSNVEDDDGKPKKVGRKARMLDLGKKMGEKFEEKRRNIEEKSRNIVEKMIGPGPGPGPA